ncbi:transposase family protein [Nonomuraea sp. JJY05]|uniref:transposase family protein n=1 Tax=Nonomuraea sp. JJY05 TaxID=3350255 RepID=UPI00373EC245
MAGCSGRSGCSPSGYWGWRWPGCGPPCIEAQARARLLSEAAPGSRHEHHGGTIRVISAPDGRPLWVSDARPAREHDLTRARPHRVIPALAEVRGKLPALADLGYEGSRRRRAGPGRGDDARSSAHR